jgi:hypothetical protein
MPASARRSANSRKGSLPGARAEQRQRRVGGGRCGVLACRGEIGMLAQRPEVGDEPLAQQHRLPIHHLEQRRGDPSTQVLAIGGGFRQPAALPAGGAKDVQTERVEGVHRDPRVALEQALPDLATTRLVEGEQQDLLRPRQPALHQVGDLAQQQRGLAGAGRGDHQGGVLVDARWRRAAPALSGCGSTRSKKPAKRASSARSKSALRARRVASSSGPAAEWRIQRSMTGPAPRCTWWWLGHPRAAGDRGPADMATR